MSFDTTNFLVFGIPPYVFFAGVGFIVGFFVYNCLLVFNKLDIKKGNKAVVLSVPVLLIGAKLFGIIAYIYRTIIGIDQFDIKGLLYSSIVFYGGLISFIVSFSLINRKINKNDSKMVFDALAVTTPMFHAFARFGCFTVGCCYGIPTESSVLGVNYTNYIGGELITQLRIPVQIYEVICDLLIFVVLLVLYLNKGKKFKGNLVFLYLLLYSTVRFFDEFLRGDIKNTLIFGLSAAQIISIALFVIAIVNLVKERKLKNV